jgi:hypothetical protein
MVIIWGWLRTPAFDFPALASVAPNDRGFFLARSHSGYGAALPRHVANSPLLGPNRPDPLLVVVGTRGFFERLSNTRNGGFVISDRPVSHRVRFAHRSPGISPIVIAVMTVLGILALLLFLASGGLQP